MIHCAWPLRGRSIATSGQSESAVTQRVQVALSFMGKKSDEEALAMKKSGQKALNPKPVR